MTASSTPELSTLMTTVFEKLGRNIYHLQKIEGMLKTLLSRCDVSGSASELPDLIKQLHEPVSKKTMGGLMTEFFKRIYSEVPCPERPEGAEVPWTAFGFRLGSSEEAVQEQIELFTSILDERNHLIHHELPFCELQSEYSCTKLAARLDDQFVRIESLYKILRDHIKFVIEMQSQLPEIIRQVTKNHAAESQRRSGGQDSV